MKVTMTKRPLSWIKSMPPPQQLSAEQLELIADIIGGLAGESARSLVTSQPDQKPLKEAPQPAPQAPPPQQPPQEPQGQPQVQGPSPSPYQGWHKFFTKHQGRKPAQFHKPTRPEGPHSPSVKPTKAPQVKPLSVAESSQRRTPPSYSQPLQPIQAPKTQPPQDQHNILESVKREAQSYSKLDHGTNLAHWLRTHYTNRSVTSQFEAAGVDSLDELTQILNYSQPPREAVNLDLFHDDKSPFAVISEPRQDLTSGGIPAVVVGPPYASQVHQLEEAFPGVHFMAVEEAARELEEAANILAKPLPTKSILPSPYAKAFTKAEEGPQDAPTKPQKPKPAPEPTQVQKPAQKPQEAVQPKTRPVQPKPLASEVTTPYPPPESQQSSDSNIPNLDEVDEADQPLSEEQIIEQQKTDALAFIQQNLEYSRKLWEENPPDQYNTAEKWASVLETKIRGYALSQGYDTETANRIAAMYYEMALEQLAFELPQAEPNLPEDLYEFSPPNEEASHLQKAKIVSLDVNPKASAGGSYIVTTNGGMKGIFKPGREDPKDFQKSTTTPAGTFYLRETNSYDIATLLGWDDLIPATVVRTISGAVGSVQKWEDGFISAANLLIGPSEIAREGYGNDESDLVRAAVLDYLFGNGDRSVHNFGVVNGKLTLIDHGLNFPESTERLDTWARLGRGLILEEAVRRNLPLPDLSHWQEHWPQIERMLQRVVREDGKRISGKAIELTRRRFNNLIISGGKAFADIPAVNGDEETLLAYFNRYRRIS